LPQTSDINVFPAPPEAILSEVLRVPIGNPNQEQPVSQQAIAHLLDRDTGLPLKGFTVRAWDLESQKGDRELGSDITNGHGLFSLSYTTFPKEQIQSGRRLRLDILDSQGQQIHQTEIRVQPNSEQVIEVKIPIPPISEPPSPTLTQLASLSRSQLSPQFLSTLANQGIRTLADVKKVGDILQIKGLQDPANNPAIAILEAYVNLSSLSDDDRIIPKLIEKKITSIADIANTTRVDFVSTMGEQVGDFSAAQLQVKARAQTKFLNNVLIGLQADSANGFSPPIAIPNLLPDENCRCQNCEAAVSPAAYLADLLDYALNHLKNNDSLINIQFLTDTFHQPFGELPTSCSSAEKQLRQVRICIEVLRHYLKANPPSQPIDLEKAEKQYRLIAYTTLLNQIGTSYEELRLIRTAPKEERQALAARLGFSLSDHQLPLGDELDRLFLDLTAEPTDPKAITESTLEKMWGLADTTRNPLAEGAKLGDDQEQIVRWNLSGVQWNQNTDEDGHVYLNLFSGIAGPVVEVYRDRDRTQKVANGSGVVVANSSSTVTLELSPDNESGLSGSLAVDFKANSTSIEIIAIPNLLSWQLRQLRSLWRERDKAQNTLIVDPDLINPGDLKNLTIGNPAYDLWQSRHTWIEEQLTDLQTLQNAPKTLEGFAEIVQNTLTVTPQNSVTLDTLIGLDTERQQGNNITPQLTELSLSLPTFDYLLRIRNLLTQSVSVPILDSEWSDVYSILVNVQKRRLFTEWQTEESDRNLTLSQDYFQIPSPDFTQFPPPPPPELPVWRATQAERRDWQDTLQTRIEQEQTVINALSDVVSKTEEETLPKLRDGLILATNVTGNSLESKAKTLIDLLLIDTRINGCQTTTRTAQAIEYTALNSSDYHQQVIQTLNPNLSADRPFSFRNQFADQWYDLNNPDQTATPMKVRFQTVREDFPPNINDLAIQHVLLYFVRADEKTFDLPITELQFTEKKKNSQGAVGGSATPIDGIISTRRGNAGDWTDMKDKSPVGEWELTLPNTDAVKKHFRDEELDDILFVITYAGRTPEWPA
jgi:hypothetical protein